jgi:2-oxoglutarate ferredoxin oxidoreductase subunit delta
MAKQKLNALLIERSRCKGCGICVHFCPKDVLVLDEEDKALAMHPNDCIGCGMCELYCPDLAIEVVAEEPNKAHEAAD